MLYSKHMRFVALLIVGAMALPGFSQTGAAPAPAILEKHCVSCHGAARMSGLDLRERDTTLKGGKRGPAIVPGKPDESTLLRAVMRQGELQMPPGKQGLAADEIAILRKWIEDRGSLERNRRGIRIFVVGVSQTERGCRPGS
jgi:mono/diheme cytochrome c family protein